MIILLYLIILIIFLLVIKRVLFTKEYFHPLDEEEEEEEHEHTSTAPANEEEDAEDEINASNEENETTSVQNTGEEAEENTENEEDEDEDEDNTSNGQTAPVTTSSPIVIHDPSEAALANENAEDEEDAEESPEEVDSEEDERLEAERRQRQRESSTPPTVPVDDACCGINIFEQNLENIHKCVHQHIKNDGDTLNPNYVSWKDIEDENTCKNPHKILSKTSNCHNIIKEYETNINALLCLEDESTEQCQFNYSSDEHNDDSGLSDNDKYSIFLGNVGCDCEDERVRVSYVSSNGETSYFVNNCRSPE